MNKIMISLIALTICLFMTGCATSQNRTEEKRKGNCDCCSKCKYKSDDPSATSSDES